jgi:hypothetical protein
VLVLLALSGWLWVSPATAAGQVIAVGEPSFQARASRSLENDILSRLSATGLYEPDDLPRLARLTVLESISMLETIRNDLRNTVIGPQLEAEIATLWDAGEAFYESTAAAPDDFESLARSQSLMLDLGSAYRQLQATADAIPGLPARFTFHLQDVSRLLGATRSLMDATGANVLPEARPSDPERSAILRGLHEQAAPLIRELADLVRDAVKSLPERTVQNALVGDVRDLLDLVRGFDRMLAVHASDRDIRESFRLALRLMRRLDSELVRSNWPAALRLQWRDVRSRMNAISDEFGLPRMISVAPPSRPARRVDRQLVAQIDRTVIALDEVLAVGQKRADKSAAATEFQAEVTRMRNALLQLRQRAIAGEPSDQLSQLLREIEGLNRQLVDRTRSGGPLGRGEPDQGTAGFRDSARAIGKLRDLLPGP